MPPQDIHHETQWETRRQTQRVAMVTMHTSPLSPPGVGDAGGMNVYVRDLAIALAAQGTDVDIFTRQRTPNARRIVTIAEGVRVITLPAGPVRPLPKEQLPGLVCAFMHNVVRFANDEGQQYGLIHSHYWLSGLVGLRLRDRWNVPVVQMFHTLSRLKAAHGFAPESAAEAVRQAGEERVLAEADAVIAATPMEQQGILSTYAARPALISTIPCGIDTALFHPGDRAEARRKLGWVDQKVVFAAGRFDPLKNFDVLIEAFALACRRRPDLAPTLRLVIAGGSQPDRQSGQTDPSAGYQASLDRLVGDLHISDKVAFSGSVPRRRLPLYYRAADLCAVPSQYESFGLTALEAMACGTPVVASDVGGLRLTVHDHETGYLVPVGDTPALADRLITVLSDDGLRYRLGHSATRAAEPYGWTAIVDRMLCLYQHLGLNQSASTRRVAVGAGH